MATLTVRPGDDEIKNRLVALWDQDPAHIEADPAWKAFGGAFIAGDPDNPKKTYTVADTSEVYMALRLNRLVKEAAPPADDEPAADTGKSAKAK